MDNDAVDENKVNLDKADKSRLVDVVDGDRRRMDKDVVERGADDGHEYGIIGIGMGIGMVIGIVCYVKSRFLLPFVTLFLLALLLACYVKCRCPFLFPFLFLFLFLKFLRRLLEAPGRILLADA